MYVCFERGVKRVGVDSGVRPVRQGLHMRVNLGWSLFEIRAASLHMCASGTCHASYAYCLLLHKRPVLTLQSYLRKLLLLCHPCLVPLCSAPPCSGVVLRTMFHPKQLQLFSAGDDAEVRVWDLVEKRCVATLKVPRPPWCSLSPPCYFPKSFHHRKLLRSHDSAKAKRAITVKMGFWRKKTPFESHHLI